MIQHHDDNRGILGIVLYIITFQMTQDHKLGYSLKTSTYRRLFRRVWLSIPASVKQKIVHYSGGDFIGGLIEVLDLDSLELLLNDPEITDVRDELIDSSLSSLTNLIRLHNFDKLNEILNVICKSAEETELFKQKIVHFYVCHRLSIDHDYELAEKLLDWSSDIDEENKKFTDHFKRMVIKEIWWVYHEDIYSVKAKCSRFLHWRLESEEEIKLFKKGLFVKLESGESSIIKLIRFSHQGILDRFLSWCLSNDERWDEMQRRNQVVAQLND